MTIKMRKDYNQSDKQKKVIGAVEEPVIENDERYTAQFMRQLSVSHNNKITYEFIDKYIRPEAEAGRCFVIAKLETSYPSPDDINKRVSIEENIRKLGFEIKTSCKENKKSDERKYTEIYW